MGLEISTVLVTDRSAATRTVTLTLAVLFVVFGSVVLLLIVAVLVIVVPAVPALMLTVITKVALPPAPDGRVAMVSVTWLPLLLSVNAGPADWLCVTNVVPAGSRSLRVTLAAA